MRSSSESSMAVQAADEDFILLAAEETKPEKYQSIKI